MNLLKVLDYFDPYKVKDRIHIIGCGSVGSTVADLLARFGLENFVLYDFDTVEDKNIVNQMFYVEDVGKLKVDALEAHMKSINPEVKVRKVSNGWSSDVNLSGYIFLCVDSISVRKAVVETYRYNRDIKGVFDFRTGLTSADHYACDWQTQDGIKWLLSTMNYSDDEANRKNPVSACGITLGVATTVRLCVDAGVANFVNYIRTGKLERMCLIDTEALSVWNGK